MGFVCHSLSHVGVPHNTVYVPYLFCSLSCGGFLVPILISSQKSQIGFTPNPICFLSLAGVAIPNWICSKLDLLPFSCIQDFLLQIGSFASWFKGQFVIVCSWHMCEVCFSYKLAHTHTLWSDPTTECEDEAPISSTMDLMVFHASVNWL